MKFFARCHDEGAENDADRDDLYWRVGNFISKKHIISLLLLEIEEQNGWEEFETIERRKRGTALLHAWNEERSEEEIK